MEGETATRNQAVFNQYSEIECPLPRAIDYQELLFHEKAIGDNGFCTDRSNEFGEGGQHMYEEGDQILHGETDLSIPPSGAISINRLFSHEKLKFVMARLFSVQVD